MKKAIILFPLLLILLSSSAYSFVYIGWIKNSTGSYAGSVNVSVTGFNYTEEGLVSAVWSTTTNNSGYFSVNVNDETYMGGYKLEISVYNAGRNVTEVGPVLPNFPIMVYMMGLNQSTLYTEEAATLNISAYNNTVDENVTFSGVVIDKKLGMPLKQLEDESSKIVYVPADRNYSITLWGADFPPRTVQITNLSSYTSPKIVKINQNTSTSFFTLRGNCSVSGNTSGVTFTDFYVYDFPNGMVQLGNTYYNKMFEDNIDSSTGDFNISIMGPNIDMMIAILANNSNEFFIGFKNISLTSNSSINITLKKLAGTYSTSATVNTSMTSINVIDEGSKSSISDAFIDAYVEYDSIPIHFMSQKSSGEESLPKFPFWTTTTPKISVFSQNYAPRTKRLTTTLLSTNSTVNIGLYTMNISDSSGQKLDVGMDFYRSNSTCDVANAPAGCSIGNFESEDFNPLQAMLGGSVSLRLTQSATGIIVHYVNVDLLASGPPDAVFDTSANSTGSGSSIEEAWKFGSRGPTVYDYVLIQTPYSDTSFDDSKAISIALTKLYDEDWNTIWDTSLNGTNITLSDYLDYNATLFTGMTCSLTASMNSQGCYVDTANNRIWLRVPHFSGIGPKLRGTAPSSGSTDSTTSGHSGGGLLPTQPAAQTAVTYQYSGPINTGDSISFTVGEQKHSVKLVSIDSYKAVISIDGKTETSSAIGSIKEIDLDGDGKNDVSVKLGYSNPTTGTLSIRQLAVEEAVEAEAPSVESKEKPNEIEVNPAEQKIQASQEAQETASEKSGRNLIAGIVAGIALVLLIVLLVARAMSKKQQ